MKPCKLMSFYNEGIIKIDTFKCLKVCQDQGSDRRDIVFDDVEFCQVGSFQMPYEFKRFDVGFY